MNEFKKRISSPTPKWFKKIIRAGITVSAAGTAILSAPAVVNGFVLPPVVELTAQYLVVIGLVAAAISKTAKDDKNA